MATRQIVHLQDMKQCCHLDRKVEWIDYLDEEIFQHYYHLAVIYDFFPLEEERVVQDWREYVVWFHFHAQEDVASCHHQRA